MGQINKPEAAKPEVKTPEPIPESAGFLPEGLKNQAGVIMQSEFVQDLIGQAMGQINKPEAPKPEVKTPEPIPEGLKDQAGAILQSGFVQNLIGRAMGQVTKPEAPKAEEHPQSGIPESMLQNNFVKSMVAGLFSENPSQSSISESSPEAIPDRKEMTLDELEASVLSSCIIGADEVVSAGSKAITEIGDKVSSGIPEEFRASGIPTVDLKIDQIFRPYASVDPADVVAEELEKMIPEFPSAEASIHLEEMNQVLEVAVKAVEDVSRQLECIQLPAEDPKSMEVRIEAEVETPPQFSVEETTITPQNVQVEVLEALPAEELPSREIWIKEEIEVLPGGEIPAEEPASVEIRMEEKREEALPESGIPAKEAEAADASAQSIFECYETVDQDFDDIIGDIDDVDYDEGLWRKMQKNENASGSGSPADPLNPGKSRDDVAPSSLV